MAPAETDFHNDDHSSQRPLKRARKSIGTSSKTEDIQFNNSAPLDHIFIADGIVSKKPGGKKAPLSCCECRRLKLKCDRNFPCASCKKRGCAEICPDGVLVSGKGTRFILANTEQLHSKIQEMSERIRSLEDALQSIHKEHASGPEQAHPLMQAELLTIKSTMGLYSGTQAPHPGEDRSSHSQAKASPDNGAHHMDHGERGSSEDTIMDMEHVASNSAPIIDRDSPESHFASEVARLSHSFPLADPASTEVNLPLREFIRSNMPSREEADYLWEQARQNALWQYNPHPNSTFYPNLAYHCYTSPTTSLSPRHLGLFFMIMAVGCLVDLRRSPEHPDAEKYHQLARACLCEIPVMEDTNVETVTALFYEIWYLLVFSDKKKASTYAWGLMGLTAKLAQSIGLHRNGKSKVIPEDVEKRRALFWELLYLDARLSLSAGRPPSLSVNYMDVQRPSYVPDDGCHPLESQHHYQEWKHSCYVKCLAPVLDAISRPSIDYETVLDLDKGIRDLPIPPALRSTTRTTKALSLQRASVSTSLEAVLLQLHRQFFTKALSGPEEPFNRRHKYAPSVVAVFLSASRMIATVQELYTHEGPLAARILGYLSNAFSAAVALCLLVSRAPFTCLSPAALQELERARQLFKAARETSPRADQAFPVLEAMIDKTNDIYNRWSNGQEIPTIVLRHITDDGSFDSDTNGNLQDTPPYSPYQQAQQPQSDSFTRSHRSLAQCIVEVHERAKALFPLRKPCQCSAGVAKPCPPSHLWSPPPNISMQGAPVLPRDAPTVIPFPSSTHMSPTPHTGYGIGCSRSTSGSPTTTYASPVQNSTTQLPIHGTQQYGTGIYQQRVLPANGHAIPHFCAPSNSKLSMETINFELGALTSNPGQGLLEFF